MATFKTPTQAPTDQAVALQDLDHDNSISSTFALPSGKAFQEGLCLAHVLARLLCRGGQGV